MKQKINVDKIKEREVSEEEIEQNEKDTKKKTWTLYRLPIIVTAILAIIYILTSQHLLLIPIALMFVLVLYGWDCHSRICPNCKKWNSTVTLNAETVLRKKQITQKNLLGKDKIKEKKDIVNKTKNKCLNCGHIQEIEKIK
mgnify:FL=1